MLKDLLNRVIILQQQSIARFSVEYDGVVYYVQDNLMHERLPYEGRDRRFVEAIANHLTADYERYVDDKILPNPKEDTGSLPSS